MDNLPPPYKAAISEIKAVAILKGAKHAGGTPAKCQSRYDIDWNGYRVDVKMSTKWPLWEFGCGRNFDVTDYYLWMCYRDGELKRAFLVPTSAAPAKNGSYTISERTKRRRSRFLRYEIDIKTGRYLYE